MTIYLFNNLRKVKVHFDPGNSLSRTHGFIPSFIQLENMYDTSCVPDSALLDPTGKGRVNDAALPLSG